MNLDRNLENGLETFIRGLIDSARRLLWPSRTNSDVMGILEAQRTMISTICIRDEATSESLLFCDDADLELQGSKSCRVSVENTLPI